MAPPIRKQCPVRFLSPASDHTALHRARNQVRVIGFQPPSAPSAKAKNGAEPGTALLMRKWCRNAVTGSKKPSTAVRMTSPPSVAVVFVQGKWKIAYSTPSRSFLYSTLALLGMCLSGLNATGVCTTNSPSL